MDNPETGIDWLELLEAAVELEIAVNDSPLGTLTSREEAALARIRTARRALGRFLDSEREPSAEFFS